uniref:ADAM_spacer1 domain-containing protein n=1 Tax=Heterorhabditis bacteriophora TaxID=37862 RepID=A0A1I7XIJ1_HETBA
MKVLLLSAALVAAGGAYSLNIFSSTSDKLYLHPLSPAETDPHGARIKRQAYQKLLNIELNCLNLVTFTIQEFFLAMKLDKCGICDGDGSKCKTIEGHFDERNLSPGYHDIIKLPIGATAIKIEEARPSSNNLALKNSSDYFYLNGNSMIQVEKDVDAAGTIFEYDDAKPEKLIAKGPLKEELTVSLLFRKGNKDTAIRYEFSIPLDENVDYMYKPGEWSSCSVTCGKGMIIQMEINILNILLNSSTIDLGWLSGVYERFHAMLSSFYFKIFQDCDSTLSLESERTCNLGPCEGLKFFTGEWQLCAKCNDTEETREVTCKDNMGRAYPLEKCLTDNSTEIPIDSRSCATQQPCVYEWTVSQWTKCSTECGHGHKTRKVVCAIHQLGDLEVTSVVDESHCQLEKPEEKSNCTNEEKCTGTWYSGPWSECTEKCGGGKQERMTVCLNYDKIPVPEWCDEAEKPSESQECNIEECPTCFDSEFGCCPDNSTFATGEFNQGCSNCSVSEFGCCADNYTTAIGPNSKGCEEYVEVPLNLEEVPAETEGSGEGVTEKAIECQVTNENGDVATVECAAANITSDGTDLFGNETDTNKTIHCSKSEFGCCPDWFTAAEGKNNEGCAEFILVKKITSFCTLPGACNDTKFGCCHDDVTLARGPNLEGCGEPTCAASLYGCCKDRKTIAFGPHYSGCESQLKCYPFNEYFNTLCMAAVLMGKRLLKGIIMKVVVVCMLNMVAVQTVKHRQKAQDFMDVQRAVPKVNLVAALMGKLLLVEHTKRVVPVNILDMDVVQMEKPLLSDPKTTVVTTSPQEFSSYTLCNRHGCCPDGETKALGPAYAGCPSTTLAPFLLGGTVAPSKISACSLPQDQGTVCAPGYKLVWYYDTAEGRCSQFWYGSCDGNDNRFATKEQCETICVEPPSIGRVSILTIRLHSALRYCLGRCYLPKIEGPLRCDQPQARYWYDHNTKQCAAFWWRGCLGNANNFNSWEECSTFCKDVGPIEATTTHAPLPHVQPYKQLEESTETPHQVLTHHIPDYVGPVVDENIRPPMPSIEEVCRSTQDSGPCQEYSDQYYYDAYKGKCQTFIYGGCGGNLNRFRTIEECDKRCGFLRSNISPALPQHGQQIPTGPQTQPVQTPLISSKSREACHLNVAVGKCKGAFDSWYYEVATGSCVAFKYSGCSGNANRFATKEDCEDLCVRRSDFQAITGSDGPPGANTICDEAKDTGPCTNFVTKWYYNKADGTCNRFHYGGCEGTGNKFDNEQGCKAACSNHQDACTLPKVQGPCSGKHTYYFFNAASQECETFVYGGCLGNTNRFSTIEECQARCTRPTPPYQLAESPINVPLNSLEISAPDGDVCSLPKDVGLCKASISMYYFDSSNRACLEFFYGGCGGNGNRFYNYEDCFVTCGQKHKRICSRNKVKTISNCILISLITQAHKLNLSRDIAADEPRKKQGDVTGYISTENVEQDRNRVHVEMEDIASQSEEENDSNLQRIDMEEKQSSRITSTRHHSHSPLPELCSLPAERGPCFDNILKWRFDSEIGACKSFQYGGCNHNANYFTSEEDCERGCGTWRNTKICSLTPDTGNCDLSISKWYFDANEGVCKIMYWSGCGGNGNRFSSKSDCMSLCREESSWENEVDICTLPRSSGPCQDAISMWFFDVEMGECRQFTYSGCRGNGNRFTSKTDCESSCSEKMQRLIHIDSPRSFDSHADCMIGCARSGDRTVNARAQLLTHADGPYQAGSQITLTCDSDGVIPIIWFKDGNLLIFSHRVQEMDEFSKLVITDSVPSDSGNYTCAVGPDAILSDVVSIKINDLKTIDYSCMDTGSEGTCALIVKTGLCAKKRYGSFCCKTCFGKGYQF